MASLRHLMIEETYELSDAILENNMEEVKKELGDLMLHIVFYACIGNEKKSFDMTDVLDHVCDKLIRRHPHVYGDVDAKDERAVKANWEKIKLKEKDNQSVLGGVPKSLPALIKSMRIQEKVRGVGFDWDNQEQVWEKVLEEIHEFQQVTDKELQTDEFGDLLFSLINYARFVDVNPEEALNRTNKKFIKRFQYLESAAKKDGKSMGEMTLDEMNAYWEKAKQV